MPHISAVRAGRGRRPGGKKEARVFYIAYVIRLSHDRSRRKSSGTTARSSLAHPCRVARSPGPSTRHSVTKIVPRRPFIPALTPGRPIEEGPAIPLPGVHSFTIRELGPRRRCMRVSFLPRLRRAAINPFETGFFSRLQFHRRTRRRWIPRSTSESLSSPRGKKCTHTMQKRARKS